MVITRYVDLYLPVTTRIFHLYGKKEKEKKVALLVPVQ